MTKTQMSFQVSQLNRNPAKVFEAAEKSPILISHRSGMQAILMTKKEFEAQPILDSLLASLIRALSSSEGSAADQLAVDLPWLTKLNEEQRIRCVSELISLSKVSLSLGVAVPAVEKLNEWKSLANKTA
jgi:PHD/YefM family antitoxin component YafN of YafNO toxin-antitoxin module